MHILLISNGYPPYGLGGVEVYTSDLAHSLLDDGHQVTVFCRRANKPGPDYEISEDDDHGVRVISVTNDFKLVNNFTQTFSNPSVDGIFEKYLQEIKPDIIHINHLIGISVNIPIIAAKYNVPFIIFLHDYWPICHRVQLIDWQRRWCPGPVMGGDCKVCVQGPGSIKRWIKSNAPQSLQNGLRKIIGRTSVFNSPKYHFPKLVFDNRYRLFKDALLKSINILVPSNYLRMQYIMNGYPGKHIKVLPLGVSQPEVSKPRKRRGINSIRFGFVGSLIPNKGPDVLLEAFRRISNERIELRIHGREDLFPQSYVEKLKESAQGDKRIQFFGSFIPTQREQIYENIDVLVIPSVFPETYSLVAREALARNIPVLASSIGALPEIVLHGINGFLFTPGDSNQLSNIINHLTRSRDVFRNLTIPGPVKITAQDEHILNIENIYQQILKK